MNLTRQESVKMHMELSCETPRLVETGPSHGDHILDWLAPLIAGCIVLGEEAHSVTDHLINAVEICITQLSHGEAIPTYGARKLKAWQEQLAKAMLMSEAEDSSIMGPVASACGLSCRHFSRAFKATVGESPQRWRLIQRIEKAKLLMLQGGRSLTDVAYECGFAEQSHFNHTFFKITGESPGAWRRRQTGQVPSHDNGVRDAPAEQQSYTCSVG